MIYLIKVWDGMEKIFEGFSRTEPSIREFRLENLVHGQIKQMKKEQQ
jgi:hypothetical protein